MLRRRGAAEGGQAQADTEEGNKYASKTNPIMLMLAATALSAPIAYVLSNSATESGSAAGGHGHSHGAGGGHRDHIHLPSGGGQLRGLEAGRGVSVKSGGDGAGDKFAPGAAGEWPLVDDALSGEGIRLELVTTRPLSYSFGMTFCDEMADGTEHMRKLGVATKAASARKGLPAFSRSMQGVEGAASAAGAHVTCGTSTFYLVDQETEYSDKIIDYVRSALVSLAVYLWAHACVVFCMRFCHTQPFSIDTSGSESA